MGKSQILGTNMAFVCYVLLKEASINIIFFCFDRKIVSVEKVWDIDLLLARFVLTI